MPVEKEPKLGLYVDAVKEWLPTVRIRFGEWLDACREEPSLIWQTPAIRVMTYGVGAVLVYVIVSWLIGLMAPGGPDPVPLAKTADFRVMCATPSCGHQFVIERKFNFDDFPVKCAKCGQMTGERAMRCNSETCAGRWVAPRVVDGQYKCPQCSATLGRVD
jgi:hypothetical protein